MEADTIILNGKLTRLTAEHDLDNLNHTIECHHSKLHGLLIMGSLQGITIAEYMDYMKQFKD